MAECWPLLLALTVAFVGLILALAGVEQIMARRRRAQETDTDLRDLRVRSREAFPAAVRHEVEAVLRERGLIE